MMMIADTYIHLLFSKHYKCTSTPTHRHLIKTIRQVLLMSSFYRLRNWNTERLINLLNVMQLVFTYSWNSYLVNIDLKLILLTICHFFSEVRYKAIRYKQRLKSMDERRIYETVILPSGNVSRKRNIVELLYSITCLF